MEALSYLMAFEALADLKIKTTSIQTPLTGTEGHELMEKIVFCPVLRAGLAMIQPFMNLVPEAIVAHVGVRRTEVDNKSSHVVYYQPSSGEDLKGAAVYILDPMIATGLSLNLALSYFKSLNAGRITIIGIMGAPEGINLLMEKHPDVDIYLSSLGDRLTSNNFITPGLGDAGDRFFGTN